MRRADRLFQIVQILRSGRLTTARDLSQRLEVSERTIYRDIADLIGSGVPVEGEAGVGYLMREGYDLPPLMFTRDEMKALVIGARMAAAWGGASTALAVETALSKIDNILPDDMKGLAQRTPVYAFDDRTAEAFRETLDIFNRAIDEKQVLKIEYQSLGEDHSNREIEPLSLYFWGKVWTGVGWCRLREDFRMFRLDRMKAIAPTGETIRPVKGRGLRDFLELMRREESGHLPPGIV